ncbi:MAG: Ferredoxin, 2Fe-2S, partial [uncultured Ramlibacter sp.]
GHHQDPAASRVLPAGRRSERASRHFGVRGAAGERDQHRARLRPELRLHHLPRGGAPGLRLARRDGRERRRPAGPRLGPGAELPAVVPGHRRAAGSGGRDPEVLDQPRERKPL